MTENFNWGRSFHKAAVAANVHVDKNKHRRRKELKKKLYRHIQIFLFFFVISYTRVNTLHYDADWFQIQPVKNNDTLYCC